jgi:hypothetical protein
MEYEEDAAAILAFKLRAIAEPVSSVSLEVAASDFPSPALADIRMKVVYKYKIYLYKYNEY